MVQPDPAGADLPGRYVFAIHTPQRQWHLAAESSFERSEWMRGARAARCKSIPPVTLTHPAAAAAAATASRASLSKREGPASFPW